MNFLNINYLKKGNQRQQQAYKTVLHHQIFEKLTEYDPILTGTIPINIDIANSDLDIICYWKDKQEFLATLTDLFRSEKEFKIREEIINKEESIVCNFQLEGFEFEIFGQNIPTVKQNAYRHMLIEHQILKAMGNDFRLKVIALKREGYKTEPAFAKLLNLQGDPYIALLNYQPN